MADALTRDQVKARGDKAAVLLRDKLFAEAAEAAEQAIIDRMTRTNLEESEKRELLYAECLGLRRVIRQLGMWANEAAVIASEKK